MTFSLHVAHLAFQILWPCFLSVLSQERLTGSSRPKADWMVKLILQLLLHLSLCLLLEHRADSERIPLCVGIASFKVGAVVTGYALPAFPPFQYGIQTMKQVIERFWRGQSNVKISWRPVGSQSGVPLGKLPGGGEDDCIGQRWDRRGPQAKPKEKQKLPRQLISSPYLCTHSLRSGI